MSQQVLEQIEKPKVVKKQKLTFEQINPKWSRIIHSEPVTAQTKFAGELNINDTCKCIVGEFYHGNDDYDTNNFPFGSIKGCPKCTAFSYKFNDILTKTPSVRKQWIQPWVNHVNRKHV